MSTFASFTERSIVDCACGVSRCGPPVADEAPRLPAFPSSVLMSARKRWMLTPDVMWKVCVPPTSALPTCLGFVSHVDGLTPSALNDGTELLLLDRAADFS